jgi:hypothetical protein
MKKQRGPKPKVCPPSVEPMLGVVSDRKIAETTGFSHITVAKWRRERGIEPVPSGAPKKSPRRHRLFGLVPDAELALVEGVSRQRISQQRSDAGVGTPPYLTTYMAWSLLARVMDEAKVDGDSVSLPLDLYNAIVANFPSEP